jgi:endonuclease III-like uncharacterized protein
MAIVENYGSNDKNLFGFELPEFRKQLLDIYGIGEETVDDMVFTQRNDQAS